MKIQWAVFGEKQRGHDLLATSSERSFAEAIAQFTDRPGDPPVGIPWGPADSGFVFKDHYVFLRTIPDLNAGRAGMVRSYAAFVSLDEIADVTSITHIFDQLPLSIIPPDSLRVLPEHETQLPRESPINEPGLAFIVEKLIAPAKGLPLVWAHKESWLPMLNAVWKRLPRCLRAKFCFAFQFEPEHKLPQQPIIVATLPQLSGRWESFQIATFKTEELGRPSAARLWLSGEPNAASFPETLKSLGITEYEFGELALLSRLVEMMETLTELAFRDALKAVRILEKHLKISVAEGPGQHRLFEHLSTQVHDATHAEIVTLRNLDSAVLCELIPMLQIATRKWLERPENLGVVAEVIQAALRDEESWWSRTVIEWCRKTAMLETELDSRIICRLILATAGVSSFVRGLLPVTNVAEEKFVLGLPPQLGEGEASIYLGLAEDLRWMRLHSVVLMRTQKVERAIMLHAAVANGQTDGFDALVATLGVLPLITVASRSEQVSLDGYVGAMLEASGNLISDEHFRSGTRWAELMGVAMSKAAKAPRDRFRDLVVMAVERELPSLAAARLAEKITELDPSMWLEMSNPLSALDRLPIDLRVKASAAINHYLAAEVYACRLDVLEKALPLQEIVDNEGISNALHRIDAAEFADVGTRALEQWKHFPDALVQKWLVELFTRTYPLGVSEEQATRLAHVLCSREYPLSAEVVRDTAENYYRSDVVPILDRIRYKYKMSKHSLPDTTYPQKSLPVVLIATALPLERNEVVNHLGALKYDKDLHADVGVWPKAAPIVEIWLLVTGAGNLDAMSATLNVLHKMDESPKLAFFVGVGGGVKDSEIGDVVFSTKVYYSEGGKEDDDGVKSRPNLEHSSEDLVQLAIRVAEQPWQIDNDNGSIERKPRATPAVVSSGEKVLASTKRNAKNYRRIKESMNDTQVVEMEGYGFLKACRREGVEHAMVLRGVSDKLAQKSESDAQGNQPLAVRNATAFLFGILGACEDTLKSAGKKKGKKRKKRFLGLL